MNWQVEGNEKIPSKDWNKERKEKGKNNEKDMNSHPETHLLVDRRMEILHDQYKSF